MKAGREREHPEDHQHADDRDDHLLHRDDGGVAIERHRHHQRRDGGIRDGVHSVVLRGAEQSVPGGDDGVTTGPHRDRGEAERDGQREPRADESATNAEERAAGDGHVGTRARPDDRGGDDGQGADGDADGHRGHRLPKAEPEQDGKRAEDDVGPCQVGAQKHRTQVAGTGVAGVLGQVLDAGRLDRTDAVVG